MKIAEVLRRAAGHESMVALAKALSQSQGVQQLRSQYYQPIQDDRLIGVEIELENVVWKLGGTDFHHEWYKSGIPFFWEVKEDGSLRNNGMEFVTVKGVSWSDACVALKVLERHLPELTVKPPEANGRTGLHVHVNVLDWEIEPFLAYVALYVVFEGIMYQLSGNREKSVFCVPVRNSDAKLDTLLYTIEKIDKPSTARDNLYFALERGNKYSALNWGSVYNHGTLEWRQHVGTWSAATIINWLEVIHDLTEFASKQSSFKQLMSELDSLKTTKEYLKFVQRVFPNVWHRVANCANWTKDIQDGIIEVQAALVSQSAIPQELTKVKRSKKKKSSDIGRAFLDGFDLRMEPVDPAPREAPRNPAARAPRVRNAPVGREAQAVEVFQRAWMRDPAVGAEVVAAEQIRVAGAPLNAENLGLLRQARLQEQVNFLDDGDF